MGARPQPPLAPPRRPPLSLLHSGGGGAGRRRTCGRGGVFLPSSAAGRTVPAPGRVIGKLRVVGAAGLGYGPADRLRLLAAARRAAARFLAPGATLTRQPPGALERAIVALEGEEVGLRVCVGSWGACALLSKHLSNRTPRDTVVGGPAGVVGVSGGCCPRAGSRTEGGSSGGQRGGCGRGEGGRRGGGGSVGGVAARGVLVRGGAVSRQATFLASLP